MSAVDYKEENRLLKEVKECLTTLDVEKCTVEDFQVWVELTTDHMLKYKTEFIKNRAIQQAADAVESNQGS